MGRKSNVPSLRREKHTLLRKMMGTLIPNLLKSMHTLISLSAVS